MDVDHGIGFHVAPGIRLRTTRRGPRVVIGPRIVRVELESGPAGPGDPVIVSPAPPTGGPVAPVRGRSSHRRIDAFQGQRAHLDELVRAHERTVVRAVRPRVAPPTPVSSRRVWRSLRRDEMTGIPVWHLAARRRARARADEKLAAELERRGDQAAAQHGRDRAAAERWWQGLIDADEPTVLAGLDAAFTARDLPAAAVGVTGRTAHVIVTADTPERLIGRRGPRATPADATGDEQGSLPIMARSRRHDLYVQAIGSALLAVAAETFAAAPGLDRTLMAVLAPGYPAGPAVIALAALDRSAVLPDGHDRSAIDDLLGAVKAGQATLRLERAGMARAPRPLYPEDDPVVCRVLAAVEVI